MPGKKRKVSTDKKRSAPAEKKRDSPIRIDDSDDERPWTESDDEDSEEDSDDDAPRKAAFVFDSIGISGPGVQIPTPGVWMAIQEAVSGGRTNAHQVREFLGGEAHNVLDEFKLHPFFLECALACIIPARSPQKGETIRMVVGNAWVDATVQVVGKSAVQVGACCPPNPPAVGRWGETDTLPLEGGVKLTPCRWKVG